MSSTFAWSLLDLTTTCCNTNRCDFLGLRCINYKLDVYFSEVLESLKFVSLLIYFVENSISDAIKSHYGIMHYYTEVAIGDFYGWNVIVNAD